MKYNFYGYNEDLYRNTFNSLQGLKNSLIIVENDQNISLAKKAQFDILGLTNNVIVTKAQFKELMFFKNKPILKGDSRLIAFFRSLDVEHKKRFRIKNIFDCIDFGQRFFKLYEDLSEERKVKEFFLFDWQKDIFKHLEDIKNRYKEYMINNGYEDKIFVYNPARINVNNFNYEKVVCINILSFSRLEKAILEALDSNGSVELFFQMEEKNYNKSEMAIKDITMPDNLPEIEIKEVEDNLIQSINIVNDIRKMNDVSIIDTKKDGSNLKHLDEFQNIKLKNTSYFKETELFSFLSSILEMLESVEIVDNQLSIKISSLLKHQGSMYFSKYYRLLPEHKRVLITLARSGYKYIPKGFAIFNNLFIDIEKLSKVDSFNEFNRFFSKMDFTFLEDNRYLNVFECFYNSLIEMNAISNNLLNNKWGQIFSKNKLSINLLKFLLKNLKSKKVSISSNNIYKKGDIDRFDNSDSLVIINFDEKSTRLPIKEDFFLTDSQRRHLSLKNSISLGLEQKYKYLRSIFSAKKVLIYYIKDMDKGLEASSIIEELKIEKGIKLTVPHISESSYGDVSKLFFDSKPLVKVEEKDLDGLPFERSEVLDGKEFSTGFYDYNEMVKCQYKYYLKAVAKLTHKQARVIYRIDPTLLGNIVHNVLNRAGLEIMDQIKKGNFNIEESQVKEFLYEIIDQEKFKISNNYSRYYEKVLWPFIIKEVTFFYKKLKSKLGNKNVKEFFIEESAKYTLKDKGDYTLAIKGKVDLRIETEKDNYVIDYKTGHSEPRQLDFYNILYYDKKANVHKWFYKFFDESIREEINTSLFRTEIEKSVSDLMEDKFYRRTTNRSICRTCDYFDICKVRGK